MLILQYVLLWYASITFFGTFILQTVGRWPGGFPMIPSMKTSAAVYRPPDLAVASKRSRMNICPSAITGHRAIFTILYREVLRPGNSAKIQQKGLRWQCHAGCWVRTPMISHECARDSSILVRTFQCRCWNRNVGCTWLRHHTTPRGSSNQLVGT